LGVGEVISMEEDETEEIDLRELFIRQEAMDLRGEGMDVQVFPPRQLLPADGIKWIEMEVSANGNGRKEKIFFIDLILPNGTATIGLGRIKAQRLMRELKRFAETY
jgi:hypothetical protein